MAVSDVLFHFPLQDSCAELKATGQICVVGVFGKSRYGHRSKTNIVNKLLGRNVFPVYFHDDNNFDDSDDKSCKLEAYFDEKSQVLFLHLISVADSAVLFQMCRDLDEDLSNAEAHKLWQDAEHKHAKTLLFMFSVCHIMVMVHPNSTFDLHYIRLFKALENIRQKVLPLINDKMASLSVNTEWQNSGRLCTPRLLFVGQQCHLMTEDLDDSEQEQSKAKLRYQKKSPLKRLEHSLEDQIYRILRKSRILTNQSANCLFTVPANQAYVHIETGKDTNDPVSTVLGQLKKHTLYSSEPGILRNYQASHHGRRTITNLHVSRSQPNSKDAESLKEFLWQHIDLVLNGKGFDDAISRSVVSHVHFEVPSVQAWFEVSSVLYGFFLQDSDDPKLQGHWSSLKSMLDLDTRFSESRCGKVLPLACRTYQEKLPDHYTNVVHRNKLSQAMRVFSQHARGPAYEHFADQLQEECERFWHHNRRLCEVVSLTGNHCIHPLHIVPGTKEETVAEQNKDETSPPIMHHASHNKSTCTCNCGRKQAQREDPFDIKSANYDFFQNLEPKCCGVLEHWKFPVFQPSEDETLEPKEISALDVNPHIPIHKTESNASSTEQGRAETQPCALSIALSLGQSGGSEIFGGHGSDNSSADGMLDILSVSDVTHIVHKDKQQPRRQASTTEYLAGMLHSLSPPGLLPRFPSWSLVCLGTADLYKHSVGLDQPGFLHGSSFLLPWDIPIPSEAKSEQNWPAPSEGGRRGGKKMDKRAQKDTSHDSHVRAYIGDEYECPRGVRFICSGPDKMLKVTGSSNIKDTANRLVTMDMPLYFPCPCRSAKSHRAQLMRVFIVCPDGPVHIRLNPRVQPGSVTAPIYNTGVGDDGIVLPTNALWVLRLPYVYVGDNGVILPPSDLQTPCNAKLLKGLFTIKTSAVPHKK